MKRSSHNRVIFIISKPVDSFKNIAVNEYRSFLHWNRRKQSTGGNRKMVAAATIVSMATAKKAQQNVFALYHSYNRTLLLGFIWILDFHFKIVLMLRRRCLIPIRCDNGKRKMMPWRWLHHFDFSTDDGCTRWWRWLHYFGRVIFGTHSWSPADKYAYRLYDCCQVWYV